MSWRQLLVLAAAVAVGEVAAQVAWKRGFLAGSDEASAWWRTEMVRLLELRDAEWRKAVDGMSSWSAADQSADLNWRVN
jgi:NADPH:quinone reductase-like Zn-dependent oxidoreductase